MSNASEAGGLRNIAALSHTSLVTDGVRTALQSVFQHILCTKYNDTSDTFLCHDSLRSTGTNDVPVASEEECNVKP